jgi:hypothetical protein
MESPAGLGEVGHGKSQRMLNAGLRIDHNLSTLLLSLSLIVAVGSHAARGFLRAHHG